MNDYQIQVRWSPEDEAWIASVPDLSYCAAHGATPHEAVAEVEVAAEAWLRAARTTGRPVPAPTVWEARA
ncbi:MAG: type II toxin-antitoxin system HicB family antitoxin [Streptosporangiaceae bacterium]